MTTISIGERGFAPTVPLLGAQGWIVAPGDTESPRGFAARLSEWLRRGRTRYEIAELDDRLLRDIGLTRYDALVESRKHFWQP